MAQSEHESFGSAVDAVEDFRHDGHYGADVDDRAAPAGNERRSHGIGEPSQRRDIEIDHLLHSVDVGLQKRLERADTRIVDQHRDARIGSEYRLDPLQIRLVVEVGGDRFDAASGCAGDAVGHLDQSILIAGHEDQVVAAPSQPVGVNRTDSSGGSGYDRDAFGGSRHGPSPIRVRQQGAWVPVERGLDALVLPITYAWHTGNARYAL